MKKQTDGAEVGHFEVLGSNRPAAFKFFLLWPFKTFTLLMYLVAQKIWRRLA